MSQAVPLTAGTLKSLLLTLTSPTRTLTDDEILTGLNYGYDKVVKAILDVRPQHYVSFYEGFTLLSGTQDYDVGGFEPPLWRPVRMLVTGANVSPIFFRYRSFVDKDFEDQELSRSGTLAHYYYDILDGFLKGTPTTLTADGTVNSLTVASVAGLAVGTLLQVVGAGPPQTVSTGVTVPGTYYGVITNINALILTVAPPITPPTALPVSGTTVTPIARRVLRLAPSPSTSVTGRLYYQYRPPRLTSLDDSIDLFASAHRDVITFYAASMLLRAVNDSESVKWFEEAQQLRSELIQNIEPLSGQNSEALGTDLDWSG